MQQLPKPGTPEFEAFIKRAEVPGSLEEGILRGMMRDVAEEQAARSKELMQKIAQVMPGILFRDIANFHVKFGVMPTEAVNHRLPEDDVKFRLKFMLEELLEYAEAVGFSASYDQGLGLIFEFDKEANFDVEKAFDGLLDLAFVVLGTAFLHRFPFNEGWARVYAANMAKERASGADDPRSTRKHSADIVKPAGWKPPVLSDLLGK